MGSILCHNMVSCTWDTQLRVYGFYMNHCGKSQYLTGLIAQSVCGSTTYAHLAAIIDGDTPSSTLCIDSKVDNFKSLKTRLQNVSISLIQLGRLPSFYCKLCTILDDRNISHNGNGCSRVFNYCFKCLGQHLKKDCQGKPFKLPSRVCWTCWMPLGNYFGCSFHSQNEKDIGAGCSNSSRDLLKNIAILFWNSRTMFPRLKCLSSTVEEYVCWLYAPCEDSVAGHGQLPNILHLFMVALNK